MIARLGLVVAGAATAQETYRLKITNTTRGQLSSPPRVVSHSLRAQLVHGGEEATLRRPRRRRPAGGGFRLA